MIKEAIIKVISKFMPNTEEKNLYKRFERWLDKKEFCRYKKIKGGLVGRNDADYLIVIRNRAIMLELKAKGKQIRPEQEKRLNWWSKACRSVWCDNLEDAQRIVNEEERTALLHKALEENISE